MDAVILAAGKGSRLDGIVPPYFKPLLVMDGVSLIRRCVDVAISEGCQNIIVVVAPENAQHIASVLRGPGLGRVQLIVQNTPMGPGHALNVGLKLVTAQNVLVLMGDNYISRSDVWKTIEKQPSIGVRTLTTGVERFTYYDGASGHWIEKQPVVEGRQYAVWCGPLCLPTEELKNALRNFHRTINKGELTIGEALNYIKSKTRHVEVNSIDIGVPEALA